MSWYVSKIKEYQKHMETFDQNVDHITNWIIQADTLLDESEKKKPQQKEDMLKVANKLLWKVIFTLCNSYINYLCPKRYEGLLNKSEKSLPLFLPHLLPSFPFSFNAFFPSLPTSLIQMGVHDFEGPCYLDICAYRPLS